MLCPPLLEAQMLRPDRPLLPDFAALSARLCRRELEVHGVAWDRRHGPRPTAATAASRTDWWGPTGRRDLSAAAGDAEHSFCHASGIGPNGFFHVERRLASDVFTKVDFFFMRPRPISHSWARS